MQHLFLLVDLQHVSSPTYNLMLIFYLRDLRRARLLHHIVSEFRSGRVVARVQLRNILYQYTFYFRL